MSRVFLSGFELNSAVTAMEWGVAAGGATVQAATVMSGAYEFKLATLSSGAKKSFTHQINSSVANGPYFVRVPIYIETLPSAENAIIDLQSDLGGMRVRITLDASGDLRLYDEDGQIGSESSALSLNTLYRIEIRFRRLGNNPDCEILARIDGSDFASSVTRNLGTGIGQIEIGGNLASEAQTTGVWYFDNVAINDSGGSFQNSYPGDGYIFRQKPNAAGDIDEWDDTTTYEDIDEVTPDDATTLISSQTDGAIHEVKLEATPAEIESGDTVNVVAVGVRFNTTSAVDPDPTFVLRIKASNGGTTEESANITASSTTWFTHSVGDPRVHRLVLYDLPGASTTAWTKADLDEAEIGVRLTNTPTGFAQVSALWIDVDYTPVAGGAVVTNPSYIIGGGFFGAGSMG